MDEKKETVSQQTEYERDRRKGGLGDWKAIIIALIAGITAIILSLIHIFTVACPVALAGLLYVWVLLAVIRYLKIHPYFRTAMVLGFSGIYTLFITSILHVIIDRVPFQMQPCDFRIWNGDYINGNTTMILFPVSYTHLSHSVSVHKKPQTFPHVCRRAVVLLK